MNDEFDQQSVVVGNACDELAHHLRRIKEVKRSADGQPIDRKTDLRKVADIMKMLQVLSRGNTGSQH